MLPGLVSVLGVPATSVHEESTMHPTDSSCDHDSLPRAIGGSCQKNIRQVVSGEGVHPDAWGGRSDG